MLLHRRTAATPGGVQAVMMVQDSLLPKPLWGGAGQILLPATFEARRARFPALCRRHSPSLSPLAAADRAPAPRAGGGATDQSREHGAHRSVRRRTGAEPALPPCLPAVAGHQPVSGSPGPPRGARGPADTRQRHRLPVCREMGCNRVALAAERRAVERVCREFTGRAALLLLPR